ncbi:hypothetical protein V2J09_001126 [Rumex salicifolius]
MAELGQQTVEFSSLVSRAAEESFLSLRELVEKSKSSDLSDTEKKINLLKYIVKTQQRMLRLNVLAKWCQQVPLIQYCQQLQSTLSSHETCFTQAADSLFFMHEGLQQARAPMYDVPSAIEVLLTGSYQRLPKCVEDVGMQSSLNEVQQKPALQKLDTLVRSKLLEVSIPKEISEVKVSNGTALLRVDGEFEVLVTLGYRGHLSLWRILHIDLLVGESNGPVKLEELRRLALGDDLERRMAAAENPFITLYSVLHEFCVALIMDTVIRQVHTLRQGRWRDSIKFELISDSTTGQGNAGSVQTTQDGELDPSAQRTPGVKMIYWLDLEKSSNSSDSGSCPVIKIEPGSDLHIKCVHSSFVIDPSSGKEAELFLDQSCIDVEKLLLKAICCNRFTRLLEIQKELMKNSQIYQAPSDVALRCCMDDTGLDLQKKDEKPSGEEYEGQEVLHVRAYGSSFFILGINIRNGRFLLQSSRNVIAPSILLESAEALNQGSLSAAEVFVSLRSRSILRLFASIGKFMGLQVFEDGFPTVKVPKNILNGSNYLIMGFPEYGGSYFLLMQPDKDFKPLFKLIETQSQHSGKSNTLNISRAKKIEIAQMQIIEDEMHLNLLDWGKMAKRLHVAEGPNQSSEHGMLLDFGLETSIQLSACPTSSFSSLVDEVFGLEKGTSGHNTFPSLNATQTSPFGLVSTSLQGINSGFPSTKRDGNLQPSHLNSVTRTFGSGSNYNGSVFPGNLKNSNPSSSVGSLSTLKGMSGPGQKIQQSKSEQDLASLRSPLSAEVNSLRALDEDHLLLLNGASREAGSWGRSSQLLPQSRHIGSQVSLFSGKSSTLRNPLNGTYAGPSKSPTSSTIAAAKQGTNSRKRTVSDMMDMLPSLRGRDIDNSLYKRRKLSKSDQESTCNALVSLEQVCKRGRYSYDDLIAEANKGNAPPITYVAVLLNVFRHCSLCIKHARLTSQMDMLDIPYVEEVGQGSGFSNIWFRLPSAGGASWPHICLQLGRPGSLYWDVKINDQHFWDLWELQKGGSSTIWGNGVRIANTTDLDSHIRYDSEGVVLSYQSVEDDSVKKLVADIRRLSNARTFALGMRKLLVVEPEERVEEAENMDAKTINVAKSPDGNEKYSEQMRKAFKIEAVGLMSLWFSFGSGVLARFVVEWEAGKEGCTMHVSPDGLWPHTKFLEEFINGGEVASLLDCIRLTAGPLHALAAATRPARAGQATVVPGMAAPVSSAPKQNMYSPPQGIAQSNPLSNGGQVISVGNAIASATVSALGSHGLHSAALLAAAAAAGRGSSGIVPSSLLPIDVSVVLRSPYWIRIVYRKNFAVDMRCFAGDQVWLQPATPPKGGPSVGGSLPCPQFRPFIMEHVAQELNGLEPNFTGGHQAVALLNPNNPSTSPASQIANGGRVNLPISSGFPRPGSQISGIARVPNAFAMLPNLASMGSVLPLRRSPGVGVPAHVRGELNTAIIGLGDDGGYGGGWVPLVALKKVLRGILKYLGVLWLFAQLPDLLKEILGSILKENEGALLNLDQEQPALRFFVGGYVFAVSVHRVQLLLQVLSVKRFHHQQQQQQNSAAAQEELTQSEITEICDYFSRRVASEPYDASRVASFITLLTLPISVLREFLKLITWKKNMSQSQAGDLAPTQKPRIELCLENHCGLNMDGNSGNLSATKSNVQYDRPHSTVDFGLTVVLDSAHIPHVNAAGGAAWLPYCVSVRLRYSFGENPSLSFLGMDGSHGGRACWFRVEEWEKCKQRVVRTLEVHGFGPGGGDVSQGRLKLAADGIQKTLHLCLQGLKDGNGVPVSSVAT